MNSTSSFDSSISSFSTPSFFAENRYFFQSRQQPSLVEDVEFSELNEEDENGNDAILFAVSQGRDDIVKTLVDQGSFVNHQNHKGETPLYWASALGLLGMVNFLLENGSNPNITTIDGVSPMHIAAANGHLAVVLRLAKNGGFVNAQDDEMDSVLHYAVRENRFEIVRTLVKDLCVRMDLKNEDMETPLELASCLNSSMNSDYASIVSILSPPRFDMENLRNHQNLGTINQVQANLVY